MPLIGSALSLPMPAGVGVSTASSFSPLDLSPALWLDASDESTLSGPGGGAVSTWSDKSGNGHDFSQATSSSQPTSGTRTMNSLNVLDFDGTTDFLQNNPSTIAASQPFTVWAVVERDTDIYGRVLTQISPYVLAAFLNVDRTYSGAGSLISGTSGDAPTATPLIARYTFDGASSSVHIDGVQTASGDMGTTDFTTGNVTRIGAYQSGIQNFDGAIAEMIFVEGTLTAQQIADTETYLTEKWMPVPLRVGATAWFDASDTDSITQSGGLVSQLNDLSGNGNNLTQGTSANQPLTGSRTLNGLNVLDFDNDDELVSSAAASVWNFLHQTESTIFVVMETDEDELAHQVIRTGALSSSSVGFTVRTNDSGAPDDVLEHWIFRGVSSTYVVRNFSASGAFPDASPAILRIESDPQNGTAASRSALYVDSGAAIANNADTSTFSSSDASSTLALGSTSQGINGAIAEVIVVDGTLTADQISATETYLADKWGISI